MTLNISLYNILLISSGMKVKTPYWAILSLKALLTTYKLTHPIRWEHFQNSHFKSPSPRKALKIMKMSSKPPFCTLKEFVKLGLKTTYLKNCKLLVKWTSNFKKKHKLLITVFTWVKPFISLSKITWRTSSGNNMKLMSLTMPRFRRLLICYVTMNLLILCWGQRPLKMSHYLLLKNGLKPNIG